MDVFARIVTGRRSRWVVLAGWVAALVALGPLIGRFESVQENEPSSFLPGDAESVKVLEQADGFPSGRATQAIAVFSRDDGLTQADLAAIDGVRAELERTPPGGVQPIGPPIVSDDRTGAILVVPIIAGGDEDLLIAAVEDVRRAAAEAADGMETAVTGPAGFSADASAVFEGVNSTLLVATASLVLVLLVIIFRSPVFWVLPLLAVFFAEGVVRGLGYLLADAGLTINGQTAGILLVLVFGAGTDYALLLTARYREELQRQESTTDAMRVALRTAGPAVIASAGTVVAALLVLSLASVNSIAGLGPVGALGVTIAALSMLTALPVLLLAGGRKAFWPYVPRHGRAERASRGVWARLGAWIDRRHRPVWIVTTLALGALALGVLGLDDNLTTASSFRGDVESVRGQELVERSFPAGASAPTTVLVTDPARLDAVLGAARSAPEVAAVGEPETGAPGARFEVTLTADPFSEEGYAQIPSLRRELRAVAGEDVLVGGPTAEEADLRTAIERDTRLIVPLVLLVVLAILVALLRAVAAPLLLVATVALSYLAALGASIGLFALFTGFPGEDPSYPLFAFIFLVALGVDYNIFLMARVREEAMNLSTREAMLKGLAVTGGVITSAGVVLAGTFLVLGVLPLVALTQIGVTVALGVLLDALVVRSVLVPALTVDLGARIWWPSSLGRRP
jgi:RND superfamily putative drug exporter